MSNVPPKRPLAYASGQIDSLDVQATGGPSWRTAAAGLWLLVLIVAAVWVIDRLSNDQAAAATFVNEQFNSGGLYWRPLLFEWLILCVWTFGIGVGAALLLWHWPRRRMVWLVVWPVLALGWNFAVVTASVSSPPPAYAVGLLMMTMCQSATMWAGGWLGRGLLVRIASVLLPPSFVAELRQLWGT